MNASTTSMDIDSPWMFAHSSARPTHSAPALALARAGGPAGTTYLYQLDDAPGGGFEAGGGTDGAHLPLTTVATYPTPPSSFSTSYRMPARPPPQQALPHTPSSVASNLASNLYRPINPNPTSNPPISACSLSRSASSASARSNASSSSSSSSASDTDAAIAARCGPVLPLIHAVFPTAASAVASASHMLEIVTPPNHVLHGFVSDEPSLGRVVFVHLPPTHASAPAHPEVLTPGFSNVLRRDSPTYAAAPPTAPSGPVALDIRESLTALLDLADEIEGAQLVLVLDKDEREPAPLAELMHALMYVGGTPVRPGAPVGEWTWDARRWALVSIEL